jgi:GNAT superfamily N-acetyltransferase
MPVFNGPTDLRFISAKETHTLRLTVLRPGRPVEAAFFSGDDLPETRHLGAYCENQLLAIASLYRAEFPGQPGTPAFQLRGMATAPEAQKSGLGRALLGAAVDYVRQEGVDLLWCNARTSALDFYQKAGFEIVGKEFDIHDVGPHFRMILNLHLSPGR